MKILVLGATGMAGHVISLELVENGHEVTAFSRTQFTLCNNIIGDAKNLDLLKEILNLHKFDYIINAIGILNKSAEDNKADAVFINSYLPHYLSEITESSNSKLIHMSTDCVFSGAKGEYIESSFKDGTTFYNRSKALGEIENDKDLTFRNSIIGPDMRFSGIGLFNWFMKQEGPIEGYTNVIWSGVTSITLAKAMEVAMLEGLTGVYHLTNNKKISKYDLLILLNKHMRNNKIEINKNNQIKSNKSLITTRTGFSFVVPEYNEMIQEMVNWILKHKELYPHYL